MVGSICIEVISLLIWKFNIVQLAKDNGMDILAFLGAIIGGAITYIGVKRTIKHEQNIRKQEENQKNIKLLTDVLNELRDDFDQIENIEYKIKRGINIFTNILKSVKQREQEQQQILIQMLQQRLKQEKEHEQKISLEEQRQNLKQVVEQKKELEIKLKHEHRIIFEEVEETAKRINLKLKKLLDEKIIYFDWKVFENIEHYNSEIEKINLKETFEDEETKKIFTTQRLELCTNIIKELKNYQAYLREEMRKK